MASSRDRNGSEVLNLFLGPYAFMDVFDSWHICNHTDEEGRYSYKVDLGRADLPQHILTFAIATTRDGVCRIG